MTKGANIQYMIMEELSRWSLTEMCEEWGVEMEDLDNFLAAGAHAIDKENDDETS